MGSTRSSIEADAPAAQATAAPERAPVDKSAARIRQMFGDISARYDLLNHVLSGGTDRVLALADRSRGAAKGDLPILDVCTGTGDLAFAYFRKAGGRLAVLGADFTHPMLVLARRKARNVAAVPAHPTVEFVEADALRLPFGNDRFQIVSVAFGLRNVGDTLEGLREMVRVCAPGGRVVVLEFSMPASPLIGALYRFYFNRILPRIGQLVSGNRRGAYHYLPESVSEFPSGEKLAAMMKSCGLASVTWTPLTFGIATLYLGVKDCSLVSNAAASR